MTIHPLKSLSLLALIGLLLTQLGLIFWLDYEFSVVAAVLLCLPLLLPLRGLLQDRLYTYKWTGFLTLPYFLIGVSESFSNPQLRLYSIFTVTLSCLLFIGTIYYSRYLRSQKRS